ncbi:MAG: sulfide/dihydroorotate dehydrogenase-like FAD/NAD-binding protein [Actinobacteria bacterium]|nr:sulfide/dihydroorotate dehydrogenase-like FAD/NAD-binding protein [Actinomycetota bacterium]
MYKIVRREVLAEDSDLFEIHAPEIAKKAKAGQFVIIRINETGERIPLTLADFDAKKGTITLVALRVGKTTHLLSTLKAEDEILDVVGPLGNPTEIDNYGRVICVGGGLGIATIITICKALKDAGNYVIGIIGARTKNLIIFEDKLRGICNELHISTDDGSYGHHGFVTDILKKLLDEDNPIDAIWAIGPAIMMKFVCKTTESYKIKTIVSLNPIMVDGTGMCGACRVEVDDKTKFTCVHGPEFDGHKVNWDLLLSRQQMYLNSEKLSLDEFKKKIGRQ